MSLGRIDTVLQSIKNYALNDPFSVAVTCDDKRLTYSELYERASLCADYLIKQQLNTPRSVGVYMGRSLNMVAALLGILKTGYSYVPLDPYYPRERTLNIIKDHQMSCLLIDSQDGNERLDTGASRIPQYDIRDVITSDQGCSSKVVDSDLETSKGIIAYVMYTSGSTGKPKPAMITYENLDWYIQSLNKKLSIQRSDKYLQTASISFSASIRQLLLPLSQGASLIIASDRQVRDPVALFRVMREQRVTVWDVVPSFWKSCINSLQSMSTEQRQKNIYKQLRLIVSASEPLHRDEVRKWRILTKAKTRILNMWGQTETSGISAVYEVPARFTGRAKALPIGIPINGSKVYILDSDLMQLPVKRSGEVYVAGSGLGFSCGRNSELTAEKFIPDPFSDKKGGRLYRTGDLARYLPDGNIEFLGRMDHQVKVRGYRVELGEIESTFRKYPEIRDAIVGIRVDKLGENQLVAYLLIRSNTTNFSYGMVRKYLEVRLPPYMVPGFYAVMESFPLTLSGKLDRNALKKLKISKSISGAPYVAPFTPHQQALVEIFEEVLGVENVGIDDNFFTLGGSSLQAIQVTNRIRQVCLKEVSLRIFLKNPTIRALGAALERLDTRRAPSIKKSSKRKNYPLSYSQERLWFLSKLEPNNPFYNIMTAKRLQGRFQRSLFKKALKAVMARHASLRTTFYEKNGTPLQTILPTVDDPRICIKDLSGQYEAEREARRYLDHQLKTHLSLDKAPILRVFLIKMDKDDLIVCLKIHHIIADGWSLDILWSEIFSLYNSLLATNKKSRMSELKIQYSDYAVWQRERSSQDRSRSDMKYWMRHLRGAPQLLTLYTDLQRPLLPSYEGGVASFELDAQKLMRLKELAHVHNVTLFMLTFSAFSIFLSKHSTQNDIVIGVPVANRSHRNIEPLIGFFINDLCLRTNPAEELLFSDFIRKIREITLEGLNHQNCPFDQIVQMINPPRQMAISPIFQASFSFQNYCQSPLHMEGGSISSFELDMNVAAYDISAYIWVQTNGLKVEFQYRKDLFYPVTIQRMLERFECLLEALMKNSSTAIRELSCLPKDERGCILEDFNNTKTDYPQDKTIHQLFEEQVTKTPNNTAVVFEDKSLTYKELNERSSQLAHYLRNWGVRPDTLVGICVERSLEMIVGILGVLKAGGAYLPLDPHYPLERLQFMIEDANISILLTQDSLLEKLPSTPNVQLIALDTDWNTISQESRDNPPNLTSPHNLAYSIYTSGSTGKPKGALLSHQGLGNLINAQLHTFGIQSNARIFQFASISYDAATSEIFMAFMSGAVLHLGNNSQLFSPENLNQILKEQSIATLTLPPSILNSLPQENYPALKTIITAGEKCSGELVSKWAKGRHFFNAYGPTETTVCASVMRYDPGVIGKYSSPPIGTPIANTQLYILDTSFEPTPIGVPGELHIGGAGLARGYLNRPDLTAEKFIPNPFSDKEGQRLYKTGDLARYLPDGNIEFLGRIDHQVKIRGFRIECGEIESFLRNHPHIQETVVLAKEEKDTEGKDTGSKYLVAYLIPKDLSLRPTTTELRNYLLDKLPDYMIPSYFILLDSLPLTPNGKLDRKALPEPDTLRPELEHEYAPPRTPEEEILVSIFQEVLNVERVGIHDNFFELGGDSIRSIRIIAEARAKKLEISVQDLFRFQKIDELVRNLNKHSSRVQ